MQPVEKKSSKIFQLNHMLETIQKRIQKIMEKTTEKIMEKTTEKIMEKSI